MSTFTAKIEAATENEIEEIINQVRERFHGISVSPALAVSIAEEIERQLMARIRVTIILDGR